jgi:hypothetical protein
MEITAVHCYLVHASKHEEQPPVIRGTAVASGGTLFAMLKKLFDSAGNDCKIEIIFNQGDNGAQQNACRDLILEYTSSQSVDSGRVIANRLQSVTTHKSGLGLLFTMVGRAGNRTRLMLSRFAADQGILADETGAELSVELVEKVFMKNASAYKAVFYEGTTGGNGFWTGKAVDRQISNDGDPVAHYWIREFLLSELQTTPAQGSRRLALALRSALNESDDSQVKSEIAATVTLAPNLNGHVTSASNFCSRLGLSDGAVQAVRTAIRNDGLANETFAFDAEEFAKHVAYRSVELDSGGIMSAPVEQFDNAFRQEHIDGNDGMKTFIAQGRIIDERFRKIKP